MVLYINIFLKHKRFQVHLENLLSTLEIRQINLDQSVESTRTSQGLIKYFFLVGRCKYDNIGISVEAVHLDQKLVESSISLVIASTVSCSSYVKKNIHLFLPTASI